ncbi:MAG: hypothetical protein AAGF79_07630 [Pseudomonadota bacterium]
MKIVALFSVLCLAMGWALGGPAALGRVLMAAGLPALAAQVFRDPDWRGVALYRAGDFGAAADAWRIARAPYNRGNALVQTGDYAAALETYDLAIASHGDADAQANFDLVVGFYAAQGIDADVLALFPERKEGPTAEGPIARGDARAAGSGSEVTNANTMLGLAELDSRGRLGVRRVFDDTFVVADERWLNQLEDVPGQYLQARINQEYKRRQKAGMSPPPAEDPR